MYFTVTLHLLSLPTLYVTHLRPSGSATAGERGVMVRRSGDNTSLAVVIDQVRHDVALMLAVVHTETDNKIITRIRRCLCHQ